MRQRTYMESAETLADDLISNGFVAVGRALQDQLDRDQHWLYHDGEFRSGCKICDKEREEYS